MIAVAVVCAGFGLGICLIVRGAVPVTKPLAVIAAELRQPPAPITSGIGRVSRLVGGAARGLSANPSPGRRTNLALLGRSPERHAVTQLTSTALATTAAIAIVSVLSVVGVAVSALTALAGVVLAGLTGWLLPDRRLRRDARRARTRWTHALTVYVDIIGISLAGGAGVEDAMIDAATIGSGPELGQLAATLAEAQTRRLKLWDALGELGTRFDLLTLRELAATATLAGESGSRIRETLVTKAAALRARQLHEVETAAAKATETMGVAPALIALAAVALIGYPAIARFLA